MYNSPVWENPLDDIILETSINENWIIHSTKAYWISTMCQVFG